jgi:hypothetical protein
MNVDTGNPFGCFPMLLALLIGGFMAFLTLSVSPAVAPVEPSVIEGQGGGVSDSFQSLTVVERVDVVATASHFEVTITGYQPDGCDFPVVVEQSRDGNQINIKIYRNVPLAVLCAQNLVPYLDTIRVEGPFEPGVYTIDVNGTVVEVTV